MTNPKSVWDGFHFCESHPFCGSNDVFPTWPASVPWSDFCHQPLLVMLCCTDKCRLVVVPASSHCLPPSHQIRLSFIVCSQIWLRIAIQSNRQQHFWFLYISPQLTYGDWTLFPFIPQDRFDSRSLYYSLLHCTPCGRSHSLKLINSSLRQIIHQSHLAPPSIYRSSFSFYLLLTHTLSYA